ncbi:type I-E CRISPR-associated protein Cas5/CasD [Miniimonas arenae]|uniref:type I-E CRISPR-associated protein Cas5/CasD n=1 Tax=Miniimonas arenae TaxID=676201 RepID=UPI0015D60FBC|nr:type I-E CRISPR-associated protein Cas5/CasD [Miniimonas arenae]
MTTLLLRLAGPLQAWGTSSKFAYRFTDPQPSKSAVLGLLAAADGRRRTDDIEDLLGLKFGVRCDQPGAAVRDFQTARAFDESYSLPLTYRFYLGDAVFVAAVEGPDALVRRLAQVVRQPSFPLYLGRRSCPPSRPLVIGTTALPLREALVAAEWEASPWYRRKLRDGEHRVEIVRDAEESESATGFVADTPVTYDPSHRRFTSRAVVREWCVAGGADGGTARAETSPPDVHPAPSARSGGRSRERRVTTHSPTDWWLPR